MDLNIKPWIKARLGIDSERAATMVEYVLILALIAIFVITIVELVGGSVEHGPARQVLEHLHDPSVSRPHDDVDPVPVEHVLPSRPRREHVVVGVWAIGYMS